MASYVQLGRGWRSNYQVPMLRRRRGGSRGVAVTLTLAAAVFVAGLLLGRLEVGASRNASPAPQPMQYYPR